MSTITNIGIDLDGTITDFHRYLVRYGKKFLKDNNIKFKIKNQKAYEINEIFELKENDLELLKEYVRTELRMKVKPRKHAIETLKELHKFIDDKIKHCASVEEVGIKSLIFDNVYNRNSKLNRINNFKDLIEKI